METIHHASCRSITQGLPALLAVTTLLFPPPGAQASPFLRANSTDNVFTVNTAEQVATSGSVSDAESATLFNGSTNGRASAAFGVLRAYGAAATVPSNQSNYSYYSFNSASWRDDWFFTSPTKANGSPGFVTVRFTIDGTLAVTSNGSPQDPFSSFDNYYGHISYTFGTNIGTGENARETIRYNGTRQGAPFLGIEQSITLPFTYGVPLENVELRIQANVFVQGQQRSPTEFFTNEFVADGEHTATWGGFGLVTDGSGNPVNDFSFTSGSGTNYSQAVPEPGAAILLLGAGLLLSPACRVRRKHSGGAEI